MTEVKMPEPNFSSWHIEDHKSLLNPTGLCNAFLGSPDPDKYDRLGYWKDKGCHREPLFTEAQLKQYGDDRAREALEMTAKAWENESCLCCWTEDTTEMASHLQDAIRELAKGIK